MAVLTADQKRELRNGLERASVGSSIGYSKAQVNDAFQAIEDFIEMNKAAIGAAIDA